MPQNSGLIFYIYHEDSIKAVNKVGAATRISGCPSRLKLSADGL
jgi:hypothetical protein